MNKRRVRTRIVAAVLSIAVLVTVFGLSGLAATGKIDGFSGERTLSDNFSLGQSSSVFYSGDGASDTHYGLEVRPGDEIRIPLTADMFTWSDERSTLPRQAVTLRQLKSGNVTVRTRKQAGADVLDYVQLETDMFAGKPFYAPGSSAKTGQTAYISVMIAEEVVSVKDLDFRFDIYLAVGGKTDDEMRIVLEGTLIHDEFMATAATDYVNTSEGAIVEASEYAKSVRFEIGEGITIDRMLLAGKKYYATCEVKPSSEPGFEEQYPEVYPTVIAAYKLSTVNMRYGRSTVRINPGDDGVYYVYDENMEMIGMSNEALRYSDCYFLSTVEIPSLEKDSYLENLSRGPSYSKGYESGELSEVEYLSAVEKVAGGDYSATPSTTDSAKSAQPKKDGNGIDMDANGRSAAQAVVPNEVTAPKAGEKAQAEKRDGADESPNQVSQPPLPSRDESRVDLSQNPAPTVNLNPAA